MGEAEKQRALGQRANCFCGQGWALGTQRGGRLDLEALQAGLRGLPGALTPAMLPGAALILTMASPVKEVGSGAKNLPIEDSTGTL